MNLASRSTGFLFFILFGSSLWVHAQLPKDKIQKIDALIRSYADIKQFNGNVLVVQKGKTVFCKSYGLADFELGIANARETKFRIGSITKQFTALLVLHLREQGLINLDSSLSNYLPWYNKEVGRKIKVKHMLSNSSGLENYTANPEFYKEMAYFSSSPLEFGKQYCQYQELMFEPGTKFNYCNTNYFLLGLIIEAVTGKAYATVLRENILDKIGMKNSGIDSIATILPNRAKGYEYTYEGYVNANPINMATSIYAAGVMYSTVDDLLRWQNALQGNKLLTDESKKLFFTPAINNYAFGLYISKLTSGKTVIGHPGGINGFSAFMCRFQEDDIIVILLDNSATHKRGNLDDTNSGIYAILMDQQSVKPKTPFTVALTETYYKKGVQQMLDQYRAIKNDTTYELRRSSSFLNDFGYMLLQKGKVKESVMTLKLAAEEAPQSANTLDSYAEALKTDKQYAVSLEYYRKALALDPNNERIQEQIRKLQVSTK